MAKHSLGFPSGADDGGEEERRALVASVSTQVCKVLGDTKYPRWQVDAVADELRPLYLSNSDDWLNAVVGRLMDEGPKPESAKEKASLVDMAMMDDESNQGFGQWTDQDLEAAKQNSLKDGLQTSSVATNTTPMTKEEEDVSKAIEASISSRQEDEMMLPVVAADPINPHERRRLSLTAPVGLKNVGNTCWFNAIAQALFTIPRLQQAVFNWSPPNGGTEQPIIEVDKLIAPPAGDGGVQPLTNTEEQNRIEFMVELRRLFALLTASLRAYVDPSPLLLTLGRHPAVHSDPDARIGVSQLDVEEMLLRIVDWIEQCFASSAIDCDLPSLHENGTPENEELLLEETFSQRTHDTVGLQHRIIPMEGHSGCLLDAMEQLLSPLDVHQENANYFTSLPETLLVSLRRFHYNQSAQQTQKLHGRLEFPQRFHIDRFMRSNESITSRIHSTTDGKRMIARQLRRQIENCKHYGESKASLCNILKDALQYYGQAGDHLIEELMNATPEGPEKQDDRQQAPINWQNVTDFPTDPITAEEREMMGKYLKRSLTSVETDLGACERQLCAIEQEISQAYAIESLTKYEYRLHAVFVHSGEADSGHYWTYISGVDGKWTKYNDIEISETTWNRVKHHSYGGNGSLTSAYCLLYVRRELEQPSPPCTADTTDSAKMQSPLISCLPTDLAAYVYADNQRFCCEMKAYNETQAAAERIWQNANNEDLSADAARLPALSSNKNHPGTDEFLLRPDSELSRVCVQHRQWSYALLADERADLPATDPAATFHLRLRKLTELSRDGASNATGDLRLKHCRCLLAAAHLRRRYVSPRLTNVLTWEIFMGIWNSAAETTISEAAEVELNWLTDYERVDYRIYHSAFRTFLEAVAILICICRKYRDKELSEVCSLWRHLARRYVALQRFSNTNNLHIPYRWNIAALCKAAITEWAFVAPVEEFDRLALPLIAEMLDGAMPQQSDHWLARFADEWQRAITAVLEHRLSTEEANSNGSPQLAELISQMSALSCRPEVRVAVRVASQLDSLCLMSVVVDDTLSVRLADVASVIESFADEQLAFQRVCRQFGF